jgi:hypothetical protein
MDTYNIHGVHDNDCNGVAISPIVVVNASDDVKALIASRKSQPVMCDATWSRDDDGALLYSVTHDAVSFAVRFADNDASALLTGETFELIPFPLRHEIDTLRRKEGGACLPTNADQLTGLL